MPNDDEGPGEDRPREQESPAASTPESPPPIGIVGIGASAGGLEALGALLKNVKMDHTAFVVIQHLAPNHDSMLAELLARVTPMKVVTIVDGMQIESNHVYVIPPNADVAILHGALHLLPPPPGRGPRLAIDYFFRSLAADRGQSAIGVILSGAGTDGTFGLKAIKAEGGITFAQDPATARSDGMPRSAIESGYADFCLAPDELGHELSRFSKHPYLARRAVADSTHLHEHLSRIFILIRKEFGNDLTYYKHSTIERRIERRMALHKIERLSDYVKYLQSNVREVGILYQDILIGVTSFFRDMAPFDLLKETIFPRIMEHKKPGDGIRVWSAGCSTGEEAYSIAMCLLEFLGDRAVDYKIQFFGTDVDASSIQYARRGSYPQNIALDVAPERLHRFFRKHENEYQVSRAVRDMVVFATQNLAKDAPFSHVDLVSCRNLLIYLQPVLQKRVLRILHYALNSGGFLMLGTSETVGDSPDLFMLTDRKNKIYIKKNITSVAGIDFTIGGIPEEVTLPPRPAPREIRPVATVHQLADRKLLDRYAPPGVLVNESFEILQFRGRSGRFLEPAPGAASLHILKQTRPELQSELRTALNRARVENVPITCDAVPLRDRDSGVLRSVVIDVIPVPDPGNGSGCMLVVFREVNPAEKPNAAEDDAPTTVDHPQVRNIERELEATKDYLQRTIEELETANEELKSSNEELQSSNEELQSTNEELETSKEELQSSN
ncbi:MAG TPA: chemotaxis protein CheB, partial [Polyangia bacterium]|nr:chemotaxis protein CheB [Polyangia bacterium]